MPFAIIFFDRQGAADTRAALRDAHIRYMEANRHRVLASGGLLRDDRTTGHGGLIILDTESRAEAEAFVRGDPFFVGGLYGDHTISVWRKAFFDAERFIDLPPEDAAEG